MKQLTNDQIYDLYNEPRSDAEMVEFANAVISEFCRINGITGEAQTARDANETSGRHSKAFIPADRSIVFPRDVVEDAPQQEAQPAREWVDMTEKELWLAIVSG